MKHTRWTIISSLFVALLFVCLQPLAAQTHGYAFAGPAFNGSGMDGAFRYGMGAGFKIAPHVTAGGEVGGIRDNGSGVVVSGNLGVHLRRHVESGLDPFVTGGVTGLRVGGESGAYANFGGGANYWLRRHVGVRAEFRTYPGGQDLNSFSEFRFGISLR